MSDPATSRSAGRTIDGAVLAAEARSGSRRSLARLLTAVEQRSPIGEAGVRALYRDAGRAHLIGLTGPPGAGKSSIVTALVAAARARDVRVAVLAIDPSSPITGGAILGDRVRMQQHASDDGVFIRSVAARGHAGGLAGTTAEAAAVLDACGFAHVIIETVGTGQSEVAVAAIADSTVVVQTPEAGDEVQAIKAGLLEVADIVVVNKADRPGAEQAAAHLRAMLTAGGSAEAAAAGPRPKRPHVILASATRGDGIDELYALLAGRADEPEVDGAQGRLARARVLVDAIVADRTRAALAEPDRADHTAELIAAVAAHETDPYAAADRLLRELRS